MSPNSPTIQITVSALQCLAGTKLTELDLFDIQFLPRREHGFNYNARQGNAVQENNRCTHTHTHTHTHTQKLVLYEEVEIFNVQAGGTTQ